MRRILVALLLTLSVLGVSAVPASAHGGSDPHFQDGHHFRSFHHGFHHVGPRLHHHHHFRQFGGFRHHHSVIFFTPSFVIPSHACDPVWVPGRWFWTGQQWVWLTEHWGCR